MLRGRGYSRPAGEIQEEKTLPAVEHLCLVTGQPVKGEIENFPLIKRVPGGTTSGVGLVSFNSPAFLSHGWEGNANAPISSEAANACRDALNRLLDPNYPDPKNPGQALPKQHTRLCDDTIACYWGQGKSAEIATNWISSIIEDGDIDRLNVLFNASNTGKIPAADDLTTYYAATISGAQGRAIIRDWFETMVGKVVQNTKQYQDDLSIIVPVGDELQFSTTPSLLRIKSAIARDPKELPANLMREWWRVAIRGAAIPDRIANRALERIRTMIASGERPYPTNYALIKAWLKRKGKVQLPMSNHVYIEKRHKSAAYQCGRMLALLGFIQTRSRGFEKDKDKPAQIVQRYFGAVMTSPGLYLGRLQKLAITAHLPKLEWLWPAYLSDELGQINSQLKNELPKLLGLEDQGKFALGYHHELTWLDSHPVDLYRYPSKRGDHWVRSRGEEAIANGLFELGIDYEYEPPILLPDGSKPIPDFRIPGKERKDDVYIEFLGMLDLESYRTRWEKKKAAYRAYGILPDKEGAGVNGKLYGIEGDEKRPNAMKMRDNLRDWFKPNMKFEDE